MKSFYYILLGCLLNFMLSSCEEVIELDLNNTTPIVVIEGIVTDEEGPYIVQINKSVDFYDLNSFPPQENAQVIISDNKGNEELLVENSPGIYHTSTIQGERGVTYSLEVKLDEMTYSANSILPENQVEIDTFVTEFIEDDGYYITVFFNDPLGIDNYYRLQVLVNKEPYVFSYENTDGKLVSKEDDNFYLTDDKFTDGKFQDYEFYFKELEIGDTLDIALQQVDQATYEYYNTLVDVIYGSGLAPSNPISNIKNGALGYFGAISITNRTIVIEE